jgi:intracellular sulfur oxidation DsrE/DsrF family protein
MTKAIMHTGTSPCSMDWNDLFPAQPDAPPLRIVLHAPTPGALARARSNLGNLRLDRPDAEVRIVVNGPAVEALLDAAPGTPQHLDTEALAHALLCPNTLKKLGRDAHAGMRVLPQGGIESLALLQQSGWSYVRC